MVGVLPTRTTRLRYGPPTRRAVCDWQLPDNGRVRNTRGANGNVRAGRTDRRYDGANAHDPRRRDALIPLPARCGDGGSRQSAGVFGTLRVKEEGVPTLEPILTIATAAGENDRPRVYFYARRIESQFAGMVADGPLADDISYTFHGAAITDPFAIDPIDVGGTDDIAARKAATRTVIPMAS